MASVETIEVVGECHRSRVHLCDDRSGLGLASERAQHAMREHDPLDASSPGNARDYRRGHMQVSGSAGFTFRHRIVRDEQIRILRKKFEIAVITVGVPGKDNASAANLHTPRERRNATVNHLRGRSREVRRPKQGAELVSAQRHILCLCA